MDNNKPLSGLTLRIAQSAGEIISGPSDGNKLWPILKFLFFIGLALIVIPTEPLKLLLRKNVGVDVLEKTSLTICCLAYVAWMAFLYHLYGQQTDNANDPSIYLAGIALYGILVLWILYVWIFEHQQEQDKTDRHRGDSLFFTSFLKMGLSDKVIWAFVEPLSCVIISAFITKLNLYIGLPILITSISFFVNEIHEVYMVPQTKAADDKKLHSKYSERHQPGSNEEPYHRVK